MILCLLAPFAAGQTLPAPWFGPATATFNVQFTGNPYDPAENDVRVRFVGPKGKVVERLAYFDQGAFRATLVAPEPGVYHPVLVRDGVPLAMADEEGDLNVDKPLAHGYIHPDPTYKNRFRYDDGTAFYPLGFNLGWLAGTTPLSDQLAKMGKAGVNWSRIWACNWDGKNPWWPPDDAEVPAGHLWAGALNKWSDLVGAAEQAGVSFQMVLFNHGSFSSKVNPNWQDHPWNTAKGGFLKDAGDFFTDAEAKRRVKMWLRYAVARYGASPSIFAWEIFNEVQWVDARYENRWGDIEAWHKEMADYIRSIDPYHHMVTTSSEMTQPNLWSAMDYYQPHTYPANVLASVAGTPLPTDKPAFYGEFGPGGKVDDLAKAVRDGIYGGMLSNQAGTAMYWGWDLVDSKNLYPDYANAAKVLQISDLASRPNARPLDLRIDSPLRTDLVLGPGAGWEKSSVHEFALPQDDNPAKLAKLSSYFQSSTGGNKAMSVGPLVFTFHADKPGVATVIVSGASSGGGKLTGVMNGQAVFTKEYPASKNGTETNDTLSAPFKAGNNTFELQSTGADWVQLGDIRFSGIGQGVTAIGCGETDWMVCRVCSEGSTLATIGGIGLADGLYDLTTVDLTHGATASSTIDVRNFSLKDFPIGSKEEVLIFKRKLAG